jgi:Glycosyl Hydrolase Family 88.
MKHKNLIPIALFACLTFGSCGTHKQVEKPLVQIINSSLDSAIEQSLRMAKSLKDSPKRLPKSLLKGGKLETSNSAWWTSGFFPGVLWQLYEYSGTDSLKYWAENYTDRVKNQQYTTDNHDVGFMIYSSFGNAWRITKDEKYKKVIHTASESLSTRFSKTTGCIRSWNTASWNKQWQYPVIIDNMMNLEMLMWSSKNCNEQKFSDIAVSHANTTMKNHYRKDYSCYHVVSYDTITGNVQSRNTAQGYSDESAWARGQAWGLYGYTMMYRETKQESYLNEAIEIARFILHHPNLPKDKIPYWDFDAPNIPNALRDASAGAVICSALIELSQYVDKSLAKEYLAVAEKQIRVLSSPEYFAKIGENGNFILKHSVGHFPNQTEIDVPLSYADYYYLEALMRYKKLKQL